MESIQNLIQILLHYNLGGFSFRLPNGTAVQIKRAEAGLLLGAAVLLGTLRQTHHTDQLSGSLYGKRECGVFAKPIVASRPLWGRSRACVRVPQVRHATPKQNPKPGVPSLCGAQGHPNKSPSM